MDDRTSFGMKITDATSIGRFACRSKTLVSLSLSGNLLDDELVKVLMVGGLNAAHTLRQLDLSHNKIGDRGARQLAVLLAPGYKLQSMDLSDNQIHANGCMHLGAHMAENTVFTSLNLRLNRCEDNGVSHLFQDLCVNRTLTTLNVSSNDLTHRCLSCLSTMLSENSTLEWLDLSSNPLFSSPKVEVDLLPAKADEPPEIEGEADATEDAVAVCVQCIKDNTALTYLDIRNCGAEKVVETAIKKAVKRRYLRSKGIPIEAYEREKVVEEIPEEEKEVEESVKAPEPEKGWEELLEEPGPELVAV